MGLSYKVDRFWFYYFLARIFYLLFTVLVFPKLTTFNDPIGYMTEGIPDITLNSTTLMHLLGGSVGQVLGGFNVLSNFPFMLLSFECIKYTVDKLELRKFLNRQLLFILLCLPSFCIWTSVCSKETIGLVFSCFIGLLIVRFLERNYKILFQDYVAIFLCLLFKPQYFPFILSTLCYIRVVRSFRSKSGKLLFSFFYVGIIIGILFLFRDLIEFYALGVQKAFEFDADNSNSTRDVTIFSEEYSFFRKAPWGMLVAFWGPTFSEAIQKPFHFLVFLESSFLVGYLMYLGKGLWKDCLFRLKCNVELVTVYLVLIGGILFVHYPFGIFNSGSATRYRNNFLFLFVVVLAYLYSFMKKKKS